MRLPVVPLTLGILAIGAFGPAAPPADAQEKALAAIRDYAINYWRSLPDYTCIRVTQQKSSAAIAMYARNPAPRSRPDPDQAGSFTVDSKEELTVAGNRESYRLLKRETNIPRGPALADEAFGKISVGEFSAVLGRIFAPETGTTFGQSQSSKLRGRPMVVFSFEVPRRNGVHVYDNAQRRDLVVGYKGLLYADAESKAVLRVETHLSDFPSESEFTGIDLTLDYKAVRLGERDAVMPYRFELLMHRHQPGTLAKARELSAESSVTAEYRDYRAYSAQSGLTFGGAESQGDVHSGIRFGDVIPQEKK